MCYIIQGFFPFPYTINSMISLRVYTLLPLLLFFPRHSTFVGTAWRCGSYWRNATTCYLFLVLYKIVRIFFNVSLKNFIFFFFKRTSTLFSSKRKYTQYPVAATGRCSIKRLFFFCHVSMLWKLVDLFNKKSLLSQETIFFPRLFYQI